MTVSLKAQVLSNQIEKTEKDISNNLNSLDSKLSRLMKI